jgi:hypothetical protein
MASSTIIPDAYIMYRDKFLDESMDALFPMIVNANPGIMDQNVKEYNERGPGAWTIVAPSEGVIRDYIAGNIQMPEAIYVRKPALRAKLY